MRGWEEGKRKNKKKRRRKSMVGLEGGKAKKRARK